ncbi:MAG: SH3 domain-containing protein [Anaerolineales bacterium]|nr:SH3 domain-containing protein [Anaerolineales bacterium]
MLVKNKNTLIAVIFIVLAALACNMPGGAPATEAPAGDETATPTSTPTPVLSETPTATTVAEACTPTVTTSVVANVRSGPGQVYPILGTLPQGGTANVAGKSFDNAWWYIEFAGGTGGYAWISTSVTNPSCIPSTLASIAAPPTPIVPTGAPSNTAVVAAPPSATSTSGGGIILLPPIFFINTSTPTPTLPFIIFPIFTVGP